MTGPHGSCTCSPVTKGPTGLRQPWPGEPDSPPSYPEPIQSRCAVLRYTKLTDAQILARLLNVIEKEKVPYTDDGLEAIIFTAQGDMRQVCAPTPARRPQAGHSPGLDGGEGSDCCTERSVARRDHRPNTLVGSPA